MAGEFGRVAGIGREPAAQVHLTVGAADDLVVGGEDPDAAAGEHVELHARAGEPVAIDELLDDAAGGEIVEVPLRQRRDRRHACAATVSGSPSAPRNATIGVAVAGTAVVVLDDHATGVGSPGADVLDRGEYIVDVADVLASDRHRDADGREEPPARALERQRAQLGGVPLIGTPSATATATSSSVTFHGSIIADAIADQLAQLGDQSGSVEQLGRQRPRAAVGTTTQRKRVSQPLGRLRRDEGTVVVEHLAGRRLGTQEHEVARLDAVQQQLRLEVAVLHRRDPLDVVRQQRFADAVGRHGDDHVLHR